MESKLNFSKNFCTLNYPLMLQIGIYWLQLTQVDSLLENRIFIEYGNQGTWISVLPLVWPGCLTITYLFISSPHPQCSPSLLLSLPSSIHRYPWDDVVPTKTQFYSCSASILRSDQTPSFLQRHLKLELESLILPENPKPPKDKTILHGLMNVFTFLSHSPT